MLWFESELFRTSSAVWILGPKLVTEVTVLGGYRAFEYGPSCVTCVSGVDHEDCITVPLPELSAFAAPIQCYQLLWVPDTSLSCEHGTSFLTHRTVPPRLDSVF